MKKYILASASPRRREILGMLDIPFIVIPPKKETMLNTDLDLERAVLDIAREKARDVAASHPDYAVIGADTVVAIDGRAFGKPKDEQHARLMLSMLSGRIHSVITAVWVCEAGNPDGGRGFIDTAKVEFYNLTAQEITEYIATGEPFDKAGGYGIQGRGMKLVRAVYGDFYTVMGLPGARLWRFLTSRDTE